MRAKGRFVSVIILFLTLLSGVAFADQTDRFNVIVSRPAMDPSDFMFIESSDSLGKLGWGLGSDVTYGWRYIDLGRLGRARTHSGLNHVFVQHFRGDLGIVDWLTIGLDMPIAWTYKFSDPASLNAAYETHTAMSDLRLSMKVPIVDRAKHRVGLAWEHWITFPTGKTSNFLGEDYPTVCGMIILDGTLVRWFDLGMNIGYLSRKHVIIDDVDFDDQFLAQIAAKFSVSSNIDLITEFETKTPVSRFFKTKKNTPTTVRQGARWNIKGNWFLEGGGEFGLIYGVGSPRAGGYLGFRYVAQKHVAKEVSQETAPQPPPAPAPYVPPPAPYVPPAPAPVPTPYVPAPPVGAPYVPTPMFEIPSSIRAWAELKATIFFPLGSGELTEEAKEKLRQISVATRGDKSVLGVRIEGFVANVTGEAGNGALAWARARNAENYFRSLAGGKLDIQSSGFWNLHLTGMGPSQDARAYVWILHTFK